MKLTRKQKTWAWISGILLLLIITNPSTKAFKDHQGRSSYSGLKMEHEFFIATEYNDHGRPYLGFLGNFIDMRERVVYIERVETERDSSVGVDSAKRILPASYKDRVYLALKENLSDFTTTKSDFYAKIKDKEYDMRVYKALKENLTDFDKTPEQFVSLVNE